MPCVYELPAPEGLSKALSESLGKDVKASRAQRLPVGPKTPGAVGVLVDEASKHGAVIFADLALACTAGGALSSIPRNIVEEGIKSGDVPANLLESYQEVMNAAPGWFERPNLPKLKVDSTKSAAGNCSRGMLTMMLKSKHRLDFAIEVAGYPRGRLAICVY